MDRNIVYFIGAGLTKSLEVPPKRIPLMNDFIAVLADRLDDQVILTHLAHLEIADLFQNPCPEARMPAIELLVKMNTNQTIIESFKEALRGRPPENIETLIETAARVSPLRGESPLTYLDSSELKDPATGTRVVKYFALGEAPLRFNFAINSYFSWVGWDLKLDLLQTFLSKQLGLPAANHTFISFNYDLSLDRVLQTHSSGGWDFVDGYGFPIRHLLTTSQAGSDRPSIQALAATERLDDRIRLLKPHGSLNWLLPFEASYDFHDEPVIASVDSEKRKRALGFIEQTLAAETEAIRGANEIYVIGWSMPMTDSGQVELITKVLRGRPPLEKVTVINYRSASDYFDRLMNVFMVDKTRINLHNQGFEDYVASM